MLSSIGELLFQTRFQSLCFRIEFYRQIHAPLCGYVLETCFLRCFSYKFNPSSNSVGTLSFPTVEIFSKYPLAVANNSNEFMGNSRYNQPHTFPVIESFLSTRVFLLKMASNSPFHLQ